MSRVHIEDHDEPRESNPLLDHSDDQIAIKPDNHATGDGHHQEPLKMGYGNPYSNIPPVPNGSNSRRVRSHAQTGTDGAFFVVNTSKLVTLFRSPPDNYSQLQQYTLIGLVIASLILQFMVALCFTNSTEKDYNSTSTNKNNANIHGSSQEDQHREIIECEDSNPFSLDRSNPTVNKVAYVCVLLIFILNFIIQLLDQIWMP